MSVHGDRKGPLPGATPGGADAAGRGRLPVRLGDILNPALDRLATTEQARAFTAWARACGDQVAGGAQPRHFGRGVLTVECSSSVWANELTYLSGQLLRRMDEVAPEHPVKRFRFVIARSTRQEEEPHRPKTKAPPQRPAPADLQEAREQAEGVHDQRLREAIEVALRGTSDEDGRAADEGPGSS